MQGALPQAVVGAQPTKRGSSKVDTGACHNPWQGNMGPSPDVVVRPWHSDPLRVIMCLFISNQD
jgi:hypothetical protein